MSERMKEHLKLVAFKNDLSKKRMFYSQIFMYRFINVGLTRGIKRDTFCEKMNAKIKVNCKTTQSFCVSLASMLSTKYLTS